MCYFRDRDGFAKFKTPELKDYEKFKGTLIDFRSFYGLDQYNLKEIDKYMWQLGKAYFPKNYGKKKCRRSRNELGRNEYISNGLSLWKRKDNTEKLRR